VNFDGGQTHCGDGIAQGNAGMGVGRGIEHNEVEFPFRLLNPAYQFAFNVRLAKVDSDTHSDGSHAHPSFDVGQRRTAINVRLALAEQVQVRAV